MAHWTDEFVGKPYKEGVYDCAHLLVDVQQNVFHRNVDIPVERDETIYALSRQIDQHKPHYAVPISEEEAQEGDVVLMLCRGRLNHIGVLAVIRGIKYVLHNVKSTGNVTLHKIKDLHRYALEVEGYYRCVEKEQLGNSLNT